MKYNTYENWLNAVTNLNWELSDVPVEHRDYNMCLLCITRYGNHITSVPNIHKDYHMCLAAVSENGYMLDRIPDEYQTFELTCVALATIIKDAPITKNLFADIICRLTIDEQEFIRLKYDGL